MAEGNTPKPKVPTTPQELTQPGEIWEHYFGDAEEQQYIITDIRQRHAAVLEQDGVPHYWLKRKLSGTICPFWDDNAGQCRDATNADATCYNTKYLGGYEAPIIIKIGMPTNTQSVVFQEAGLLKTNPQRPWTLWTPKVSQRDILVNYHTGERYELLNVTDSGPWRGLIIAQYFDVRPLQRGADFGYEVPILIADR